MIKSYLIKLSALTDPRPLAYTHRPTPSPHLFHKIWIKSQFFLTLPLLVWCCDWGLLCYLKKFMLFHTLGKQFHFLEHLLVGYHGRVCKSLIAALKQNKNIFYAMNTVTQFLWHWLSYCSMNIFRVDVFFRSLIFLKVLLHAFHVTTVVSLLMIMCLA